ncbi:hypothetical protein Droror1_Dr00019902 [Drosera rotundifolia]
MDQAPIGGETTTVIIIGAGISGIATAACLSRHSIPYLVLEREDCSASLWRKMTYDRLHLHVPKHLCHLPYMPFPATYPRYTSKDDFLRYIDDYVSYFEIRPLYKRDVVGAEYDEEKKGWSVKAVIKKDGVSKEERYWSRFLVVATGENTDPFVPEVQGLSTFNGKVVHSTEYRSGKEYENKKVLVVGCGNSGMEIGLDLANHGANTSIVIRSPVHVQSREMLRLSLALMKYIPIQVLDSFMTILGRITYGDLTRYGIYMPKEGAIAMRLKYGKYPIIDVGSIDKIKKQEIQVLPAITSIRGNDILFENGRSYAFDAIVFATGFRRSTMNWIQGGDYLFDDEGLPKPSYPKHWKGENGLYCVGLSRSGIYGATSDAANTADDIRNLLDELDTA